MKIVTLDENWNNKYKYFRLWNKYYSFTYYRLTLIWVGGGVILPLPPPLIIQKR